MAEIRLDEWRILHSIGEGAFGEVRFLLHRQTNATLAVKIIDVDKFKHSVKTVKKEIAIHKLLSHENIIKFCGHITEGNFEYIFLQYASGGELFDRIEPDVGMSQSKAHRYFCQLVCGVTYLHGLGITHRDIKPENLLLDDQDVIKISDFGMATLFRHNGVERKLNYKCGSLPYMAPEVYFGKEYRAEPADIWSCGIVLIAMLAGELPWDEPSKECPEFCDWKEGKLFRKPWMQVDTLCLCACLCCSPSNWSVISSKMKNIFIEAMF